MVQFEIEVKILPNSYLYTDYRKEEAVLPHVPNWSRITAGGRTYGPHVCNVPPEPLHRKRRFKYDQYYKSYHVEYWIQERRSLCRCKFYNRPPDKNYMDEMLQLIKPLPGEFIIVELGYGGLSYEQIESMEKYLALDNARFVNSSGVRQYTFKVEEEDGDLKAVLIPAMIIISN